MEVWKAVLLGLVQGVTEFLPVSSSGHLVLVQNALGVSGEGVMFFDVSVHVGTLVAVLVALRERVVELVKKPLSRPMFNLAIATVPAGLVGLLLGDYIEALFDGRYLFVAFFVTGVLLLVADYVASCIRVGKGVSAGTALVMGLGQALAVVPGLSRSGTTLAMGLTAGGKKEQVADFSFLMSVPVILGAGLIEAKDLFGSGMGASSMLLPSLVGAITAGVAGYFAVKWMLGVIKNRRLWGFSIYLFLLSGLTFVNYLITA